MNSDMEQVMRAAFGTWYATHRRGGMTKPQLEMLTREAESVAFEAANEYQRTVIARIMKLPLSLARTPWDEEMGR